MALIGWDPDATLGFPIDQIEGRIRRLGKVSGSTYKVMILRYRFASAVFVAASALYAPVITAASIELSSQLSSSQEVPAAQSAGKGQLRATLDTSALDAHLQRLIRPGDGGSFSWSRRQDG